MLEDEVTKPYLTFQWKNKGTWSPASQPISLSLSLHDKGGVRDVVSVIVSATNACVCTCIKTNLYGIFFTLGYKFLPGNSLSFSRDG